MKSSFIAIDAVRAEFSANLATLDEVVAHLPGKGFIVVAEAIKIVLLSGAVLFSEKLKMLIGL